MRPLPCSRMTGSTALQPFTMPKRFTSSSFFAWPFSVNSAAPEMPKPALFTRMSIRPSASFT